MKTTRFYISRSARPFVVWDALRTTVAQALSLVQEFPFEWCVLTADANYYVLPVSRSGSRPQGSTEEVDLTRNNAWPEGSCSQPGAAEEIRLDRSSGGPHGVRPSAGQAVSLGKRGDTKIVSAVWVIQRSAPPIPSTSGAKKAAQKFARRRGIDHGRKIRGLAPAAGSGRWRRPERRRSGLRYWSCR